MKFSITKVASVVGLVAIGSGTAFAVTPPPSAPNFNISVNFGSGLTLAQQGYFTQAVDFWKSVIIGYGSGITDSALQGITITASARAIDGVNGTLGQAGPSSSYYPSARAGGYTFVKNGFMEFDTADLANLIANGTMLNVVKHEMAHVLGFGTVWEANNVYDQDQNEGGVRGQYTGAYALAAYRTEFNKPGATYIPVELGGGAGTADAHWNESDGGGSPTGIKDSQGRDMQYELMTGWLNPNSFISNTTLQSFRDLGYAVATRSIVPVPVPGAVWLFGSAISLLSLRVKQRRA